jgi:hypothetical protein
LSREKKAVLSKKVMDVKNADKALGEDKIEEIVQKEWNVAPLPSEEDLKNEEHESPKARTNINSRKNLIQYRTDIDPEVKEGIVKNLRYKTQRKDIDVNQFFGDTLIPELIEVLIPLRDALENADEETLFFGTVKQFVSDFPKGELNTSDVDDIATLALNRILELRLLRAAKDHPGRILDAAAAIERFRKHSDKIKMHLANRRMDRVDVKNKQSYSIVDLAAAFDDEKKKEMEARIASLLEEEKRFKDKRALSKPKDDGDNS